MRVLVIEDHAELAETVALGLQREGMAVDLAFDGTAGLQRAAVYDYDVIVLDRDLPGVHGDRVCEALVSQGGRARVLMLTASAGIEDRVAGLSLGADDYLPKPLASKTLRSSATGSGRFTNRLAIASGRTCGSSQYPRPTATR